MALYLICVSLSHVDVPCSSWIKMTSPNYQLYLSTSKLIETRHLHVLQALSHTHLRHVIDSVSFAFARSRFLCIHSLICSTDKRDLFFRGNKCVKAYFHYFGYIFISLNKASPQNLSHFWQSISASLLCCTIKPGQAPTTTRFHPHPHPHPHSHSI